MFKAVLFDLDGTLLNRDKSIELFINQQYERLFELLSHISKEQYISRFIELDNSGYIWKDKVYQQLIDEFNISSVTCEVFLQDYLKEFKNHCVGFPHIHEMLEELKNNKIALGMITNGFGQFQMENIKALNIDQYFDVILVSEWEGMKKPNPQIFINALEKLNVEPSESVFIGDHPENDVKAAQNVGMKGIWKRDNQWTDIEADAIIDDYLKLPEILKKLDF
ncbi:HAD family hydrolase [Lysinibacillus varians]|uniref:HAD family hydrolase n=1 Tax=Lysinibacillus varians TaxID=1145276 RepID=A0ABY2T8M0_9BACI|nr:HAD family hydrolase [Lysinibacillus varians]AHN21123.1 L-2-haloalkanoic acid dehalogenase [Lysinibacillus varians]TKI59589.1 HAD family hydrolase [Lysinibacillus varians]